jgi:hypothetical protein
VTEAPIRQTETTTSFARRAATLQVRHAFITPRRIALFTVIALLGVASLPTSARFFAVIAALYFVFYGALFAWAVISGARTLGRVTPNGTALSAQLGENSVTIVTPSATTETPYSTFSKAVVHGDILQFHYRSSRILTSTYPTALFPGDDLAQLQQRIAGASQSAEDRASFSPAVHLDHAYATGDDYPKRLATAMGIWTVRRPAFRIVLAVFVLAGLGLIAAGIPELLSVGSVPNETTGSLPPTLVVVGLSLLIAVVAVATSYRFRIGRTLRCRISAGSTYGITLADASVVMKLPGNTVDVEYSRFRSVQRVREFVVLGAKPGMTSVFLPIQLLPADDLAKLTRAIETV